MSQLPHIYIGVPKVLETTPSFAHATDADDFFKLKFLTGWPDLGPYTQRSSMLYFIYIENRLGYARLSLKMI
jgi:hypothetical protein